MSNTQNYKILVTGSSGDIGASLLQELSKSGHEVVALVRNNNSIDKIKKRRLRGFHKDFNIKFITHDFVDIDDFSYISDIDICYHFAGIIPNFSAQYQHSEEIVMAVNAISSIFIIKKIEQLNPNVKFIFASTQKVYEVLNQSQIVDWIHNVCQYLHQFTIEDLKGYLNYIEIYSNIVNKFGNCSEKAYAVSKFLVEYYLEQYSSLDNWYSVRISNLVGCGLMSGRLPQRLIESANSNYHQTILQEFRDYISVNDAAKILSDLSISDLNVTINQHIIDLCSGQIRSTSQLWDSISARLQIENDNIKFTENCVYQNMQDNSTSKTILEKRGLNFTSVETEVINQVDEYVYKILDQDLVIVIDAGGTKTRFNVWNGSKLIEKSKIESTPNYLNMKKSCSLSEMQEQWLFFLNKYIQEYKSKYKERIQCVAIAFAGRLDKEMNILASSVIWTDKLDASSGGIQRDIIECLFELPVFVANDLVASITRYSERFDSNKKDRLMLLTVSSGVGIKCYANGILALDEKCRGGEIGHVSVTVPDHLNSCQSEAIKNELNYYCSGRGLANLTHITIKNNFRKYKKSKLYKLLPKNSFNKITEGQLTKFLIEGINDEDEFCKEILKSSINILLQALIPAIMTYAPTKVILVGGIIRALKHRYLNLLISEIIDRGLYGYDREDLINLFILGENDDNDNLVGIGIMANRNKIKNQKICNKEVLQSIAQSNKSIEVHFSNDIFFKENSLIENLIGKSPAIFFVEKRLEILNSIEKYINLRKIKATTFSVQGGESIKQYTTVLDYINKCIQSNLPRNGIIIGVGGGALMDVVGTVAMIYRRGIKYIRIPTTLLGQVDAGIGVKVGINYGKYKNLLGGFYPPSATICDEKFLSTLNLRQIKSGIAEIIKIAIVSNEKLFSYLEKNGNDFVKESSCLAFIKDAANELLHHLQRDYFEKDLWRHIDFGHCLAHSIESLSNYEITHGEAVAIDILFSTKIALHRGLIDFNSFERILNLHKKIGLPFYHKEMTIDNIKKSLESSKAHKGGLLKLVIPIKIGKTEFIESLSEQEVIDTINFLKIQSEEKERSRIEKEFFINKIENFDVKSTLCLRFKSKFFDKSFDKFIDIIILLILNNRKIIFIFENIDRLEEMYLFHYIVSHKEFSEKWFKNILIYVNQKEYKVSLVNSKPILSIIDSFIDFAKERKDGQENFNKNIIRHLKDKYHINSLTSFIVNDVSHISELEYKLSNYILKLLFFINSNYSYIKYDLISLNTKKLILKEVFNLMSLNLNHIFRSFYSLSSSQPIDKKLVENFLYNNSIDMNVILYHPEMRMTDIRHSKRLKKAVPITALNQPLSPYMANSIVRSLLSKSNINSSLNDSDNNYVIMGKYAGGLILGALISLHLGRPFVCLTKKSLNKIKFNNKKIMSIAEPHLSPDSPDYCSTAILPSSTKKILFVDDEATSGEVIKRINEALEKLNIDMCASLIVLQSSEEVTENICNTYEISKYHYLTSCECVQFSKQAEIIPQIKTLEKNIYAVDFDLEFEDDFLNIDVIPITQIKKKNSRSVFIDYPWNCVSNLLLPEQQKIIGHQIRHLIDTYIAPISKLRREFCEIGKTLFLLGDVPAGMLAALPLSLLTGIPIIGASNRPEPKQYKKLNISSIINYIDLSGNTRSIFGLSEGDGVILLMGQLTDGQEQLRIITSLKHNKIKVVACLNLIENIFYNGKELIQNFTEIDCYSIKQYYAIEPIHQINYTQYAFDFLKYILINLECHLREFSQSAFIKAIYMMPNSFTVGLMLKGSDIDQVYIVIDGIDKYQASELQKILEFYYKDQKIIDISTEIPIIIPFSYIKEYSWRFDLDNMKLINLYKDGILLDSAELINNEITPIITLMDKHIARVRWFYSSGEIEIKQIKALLQYGIRKKNWPESSIQFLQCMIDDPEPQLLSDNALEFLEKLDFLYINKKHKVELSRVELNILPELLYKEMVRIYDNKLLLVWRHGSAVWSNRFWSQQIEVVNINSSLLHEIRDFWLYNTNAYKIFINNLDDIQCSDWSDDFKYPLVYELILLNFKNKSLSPIEKKHFFEALLLKNAFVRAAAIQFSYHCQNELSKDVKKTIIDDVCKIINSNEEIHHLSPTVVRLVLLIEIMKNWQIKSKKVSNEDFNFIYYRLVPLIRSHSILTVMFMKTLTLLQVQYCTTGHINIRNDIYKLIYELNQFDSRSRIVTQTEELIKKIPISHNKIYYDRLVAFREFERSRFLSKKIDTIILDWDDTLISSKLFKQARLEPLIAFCINWLTQHDKVVVITTAAGYTRFYRQALDKNNIKIILDTNDNLIVFNDYVSYLNNKPTKYSKYPDDFKENILPACNYLVKHYWQCIPDERVPRISFVKRCDNKHEIYEQAKFCNSLLNEFGYKISISIKDENLYNLKIYYATKANIFDVKLPNKIEINPSNCVLIADDGIEFGVDKSLFENTLIPVKFNVGNESIINLLNTINTETNYVTATKAILEGYIASVIQNDLSSSKSSLEDYLFELEEELKETSIDFYEMTIFLSNIRHLIMLHQLEETDNTKDLKVAIES